MRELTGYEKQKWFDELGRFDPPRCIYHGDELGEAYDALIHAENYGTYLSEEIVSALQVEILDQYYICTAQVIRGESYDPPEAYGLPATEEVTAKYEELSELGILADVADRMAVDWAMDWREEHREETNKRLRKERLEQELERLG